MPNCFALTKKGECAPEKLTVVDEMICEHLNIPVHPVRWCRGWYDSVVLMLACGKTWDEIRKTLTDPTLQKIINFLEENFEVSSWYEHK